MALPLLIGKNVLTLASAKKLAEAAEQFALRSSWNVVIPIVVNESIVGVVGVSGCAASSQDGEVAEAASKWFLRAIAGEA
jgi:uncharacterized protein GlcG (DUF336 family)